MFHVRHFGIFPHLFTSTPRFRTFGNGGKLSDNLIKSLTIYNELFCKFLLTLGKQSSIILLEVRKTPEGVERV